MIKWLIGLFCLVFKLWIVSCDIFCIIWMFIMFSYNIELYRIFFFFFVILGFSICCYCMFKVVIGWKIYIVLLYGILLKLYNRKIF